ncbi:MAG: DUF4304 domain-containing protein [Paracoccaceae bacterium]
MPEAEKTAPNPPSPDQGARIHRAAHDPEFAQKREAAINAITAAIDAVAEKHGFTRKAKSWAKDGPAGRVSIQLQRSRYGWECHVNLSLDRTDEQRDGIWAHDDFVGLGEFYTPGEGQGTEQGAIYYLDVHEDPAALDLPIQVLDQRALPWLQGQLDGQPPEIGEA